MKRGARGQLFVVSLALIGTVGAASAVLVDHRVRLELTERSRSQLVAEARLVQAALEAAPDADALVRTVRQAELATGASVTLFSREGEPREPFQLERSAHRGASRGMTTTALDAVRDGEVRVLEHASDADGPASLAVALRYPQSGALRGIVQIEAPLERVEASVRKLRLGIALAAGVGLAIAVAMSGLASQLMTRQLRALVKKARRVSKGKEERISLEMEGELGKLAGSFNRITDDLHKVEAKLGRERARLHTVLEAMEEAVLALDESGQLRLANAAALEALGLTEHPGVRPLRELTPVTPMIDLAARSVAGTAATAELDLPTTPPRRYLVRATPLETVGGAVLVMHDVSELRRVEAMRRDFVANVSHELRTPVSVIEANAETLLAGGLDDPEAARTFLEAIVRSSERLARLISDLLDLSRIEAGHYAIHIEPIPVAEALADTVTEIGVHAEEQGIVIEVEADAALAVAADGAALEHVLLNLLDNALKYTPSGGHVVLRATGREARIRLEIDDDGPGVAPEHRERVFERFYRVDDGRSRDVGGTGLGLSIVKHLVETMGGAVGVEASRQGGACFWVELPRA
ncbi:MAG: PAS domain-containing protein [Deltaproteobacteria bacterium]|nr:PAS domain-containing protein [Deltaproteobacteria bacterium]